jgi:calcineurin-like phosphoesterase family protein
MEEAFFDELSSKIKPEDTAYLLGDIIFKEYERLLNKLNAKERNIHLIKGNHDQKKTCKEEYWSSINDYKEIKIGKQDIILCHFPIESWNRKKFNTLHFHGHTHGNASHSISTIRNRIDVGYDNVGKFLISYEEILILLEKQDNEEK